MNIFWKTIAFAIIIALASCVSGGKKTETKDAEEVGSIKYDQIHEINTDLSIITWEGFKPTGTHVGTIAFKNGELMFWEGKLIGGSFTIDMLSIVNDDLTDPEMNAKLVNHLLSSDFFEAETYPEAMFEITKVVEIEPTQVDLSKEKGDIIPTHAISGSLTLKDVTKNLTFHANLSLNGSDFSAQTNQFFIDRVDWNVRYGSKKLFAELKDNFINDEMGISINLVSKEVDNETESN